jgi:glycosyltransferase involved in cell wall biosynthesis
MRRILLVNTYYHPHYGGIETSLYYIAQTLLKMQFKPVILTSDRGVSKKAKLSCFEKLENVPVHRFSLPKRKGVINTISILTEYLSAKQAAFRLHQEEPFW